MLDAHVETPGEHDMMVRRERQDLVPFQKALNFRSSRLAEKPSKTMLQVLQTRAKQNAYSHAQATHNQKHVIAEGRIADPGPAAKIAHHRNRRASLGLDNALQFEGFANAWMQTGTSEDLCRPENNATGIVMPGDRDMIIEILARSEGNRVEELLRRHVSPPRSSSQPTSPMSPRPGLSSPHRHTSPKRPDLSQLNAELAPLSEGRRSLGGYLVPDPSARAASNNKYSERVDHSRFFGAPRMEASDPSNRRNLAWSRSLEYPITYPKYRERNASALSPSGQSASAFFSDIDSDMGSTRKKKGKGRRSRF